MQFFDGPSLPGNGDVSGAFWHPNREILAVASNFRRLTEPRARAAYGGHRLRHRLALYRPPETRPFAVFDEAQLPINDVAFHPFKPVIVIGAGSYDGGYAFEGQLVTWDWQSGHKTQLGGRLGARWRTPTSAIPEVVRAHFTDDGSAVRVMVRPWHEEFDEGKGDSFDQLFELTLAYDDLMPVAKVDERQIASQIDNQTAQSAAGMSANSDFLPKIAEIGREIARAFKIDGFRHRSPIWDVSMIDADTIATVHDGCLLDTYSRDGQPQRSFKGDGHGTQILRTRVPIIHVMHFDKNSRYWAKAYRSELMALVGERLSSFISLDGSYTFSVSGDGTVLGRLDRSAEESPQRSDVIIRTSPDTLTQLDLGHYDVFNHYLRIDGAPYLFFVQGTPPRSHEQKHLCLLGEGGTVRRLWPLLEDTGEQAGHAMECCFAFVHDGRGQGIVAAGRRHHPNPSVGYDGFIYRKNLADGKKLWEHPTTASATTIKEVRERGVVVVAFLDGGLAVLLSDTGEILHWDPFEPGGYPSVIFSMDADASRLIVGTIDGRCGVLPISELSGGIR